MTYSDVFVSNAMAVAYSSAIDDLIDDRESVKRRDAERRRRRTEGIFLFGAPLLSVFFVLSLCLALAALAHRFQPPTLLAVHLLPIGSCCDLLF